MSDLCKDLFSFIKKLGFQKFDETKILRAFTHPSYSVEHGMSELECYERLEFLGDAVLKLVVSDILFKKFPSDREGKLTNIRAILVSDDFLYNIAEDLGFKKYIKISKALEKEGGRDVHSITACVFEAFLGALFDSGVELGKISEFLNICYLKHVDDLKNLLPKFNSKAVLQEYTQALDNNRPEYVLTEKNGAENNVVFTVKVFYNGEELGTGSGKTKKQAEREAAYQACLKLKIMENINE